MDDVATIGEALKAIIARDLDGAKAYFAPDCTILLPRGPYWLTGAESLANAPSLAIATGGRIQVGQTQQRRMGRASLVAMSWISYPADEEASAQTGYCTALIADGKIAHFHLSLHI